MHRAREPPKKEKTPCLLQHGAPSKNHGSIINVGVSKKSRFQHLFFLKKRNIYA